MSNIKTAMGNSTVPYLEAEIAALHKEVERLGEQISDFKKRGVLLGQISEALISSGSLPCDPDEFAWEDIPELLAEMLEPDDRAEPEKGGS